MDIGADSIGNCSLHLYPAIYPGVIRSVKVLTGVASSLSIAAACWIIVTYFLFKDLRTTARQLLVNLSIADILVAGSHFVGAVLNYERFIPYYNNYSSIESTNDTLCVSQAAVTMFSSISSFLWTMSIAIYMLTLTVSGNKKILKWMVVVMYVVCWTVPVVFVIASSANKFLGFQYTGATGCYSAYTINKPRRETEAIVMDILSYEIWVYMAYIFLPIIYLVVIYYIRCRKSSQFIVLAATKADIKLLLIPITFLLLRIWTTLDDIFAFYTSTYESSYRCSHANAVLLFFQTIGINSQGTVNAILFCLLTKQVRKRWYLTVSRPCRHWCGKEDKEETVDMTSSQEVSFAYGSINASRPK